MKFLDNGVVRVGVNLDAGGAITHLSLAGERAENLVNNWDWGRQIQMSNYSGPVPFVPEGKELAKVWAGLGWNPVQAGDAFRHASRVLSCSDDGKTIELSCVPMQWPLNNVPSECEFSTRISLEKNAVRVDCKMTNHRADLTQYPARNQELPAVYTIGKLYRLFSYTGEKPFAGDAVERIAKLKAPPGIVMPQWGHWAATENWAALVDDHDFGVGVWTPSCFEMSGGFWGKEGVGETHDDPTGYIGPTRPEILDHDIVYQYSYVLIVGSLNEIRAYAVNHGKPSGLPAWKFAADRQGWFYINATDSGWPIRGLLDVKLDHDDPQLIGPPSFWRAADAPRVQIEAAFKTSTSPGVVYFRGFGDHDFSAEKFVSFPVNADRAFHEYDVDLSKSPAYRGAIVQLRIDPEPTVKAGDWVKVKSVELFK